MKIIIFALIISVIDAFEINCAYMNVVYPSLGLTYTCMVHRSLSITSPNQQTVTRVRGIHLAGRTNADVRMVNFDDVDDLVVVPRGLSAFFSNIEGIRIFDSDVRNLNGNELNEYVNLRWFVIFDSDVIRIPGNFFERNPNLIYVSFDDNDVRQVSSELFSSNYNVTGMHFIGFRDNICINRAAITSQQIENLLVHLSLNCSDGVVTLPPTESSSVYTTPGENTLPKQTTTQSILRTRTRATSSISTTWAPQPIVELQNFV